MVSAVAAGVGIAGQQRESLLLQVSRLDRGLSGDQVGNLLDAAPLEIGICPGHGAGS
jgi:hypothetical protein